MAFVERASCPFLRQARCPLPNPTHSLWNGHLARSGGRQDARPTIQLKLQLLQFFLKGNPAFRAVPNKAEQLAAPSCEFW